MTGEGYNLISIGTLILFFYSMSLLLVRFSILSRQQNRRFWNFLLLIFFSSTALLGLFLVIKVNYKLDIPWVEELMQWHVDSGIGFAIVAIFHLLWNIHYYTRRRSQPGERETPRETSAPPRVSPTPFRERTLFLMLGYISIMAQLVLLREFIKSFHGNELVIGIFLAIWMILTAMGSLAGTNYQPWIAPRRLYGILILMGALPLLIEVLLILVTRLFFLPGFQPGLADMTTWMLLLTSLFTGASGFLFGYLSKSVSAQLSGSSAYRLDAMGSLAGGVIFSLVAVRLLSNLQHLSLLFLSTVLLIAWVYKYPERIGSRTFLIIAGAGIMAVSLVPEAANRLEGLRYRNETILKNKDTPFGNLTFTSRNKQVTAYLDGNPVLSSADLTRAEESVHFPALQHPRPESFLLLGGGLAGYLTEIAKYQPERIDYCEADPWIFRLGSAYFTGNPPGSLQFIPEDGRSWLMKSGEKKYDVVISTAGDPVTLGWNRYFTLEFYELVSRHLKPGGIFCMQLATGGNYVNNEGSQLLGINYHTLNRVFSNVVVVPGSSSYFLASEAPLSLDFPGLVEQHHIPTTYVHPDYLDAMQLTFDSDQLTERILTEKKAINTDLRPRLFFASLSSLESRMGQHSLEVTGIISALLFLLLWLLYSPVKTAMYTSGFTGAGIQIVLIMVMQSFYGFVYLVAPMMITVFMGGLAMGTLLWKRIWHEASTFKLAVLTGLMALLPATGYLLLMSETLFQTGPAGQLILGVLNLFAGASVGMVFTMAVNLHGKSRSHSPGILFSADLTGAALGTLLPVIFLLPLIGVMNTFILFMGINMVSAFCLLGSGHSKRSNG